MGLLKATATKAPKTSWGLFTIFWKYKFWIILFLVLLPTIIQSVEYSIETRNPSYPFFQLAKRIFVADHEINKDVMTLENNPSDLVGMIKPTEGIWLTFVYYWKFFFNVIWKILGNVWLIFFPLIIIHKIMRGRNTSEEWKAWTYSFLIFILYLFVTNVLMLLYGVITGSTEVIFPKDLDSFGAYYQLFILTLPFHGLVNLLRYLIVVSFAT